MRLNYTLFAAGYCTHLECITLQGGSWRAQSYPALCSLIQHPNYGNILFDTGYSAQFFHATKHWPLMLYQKITPAHITDEQTLVAQLRAMGIEADDINYIFLSHFHADHIAGLRHFPKSKILCSREGFAAIQNQQGFRALKKGFLPKLLPTDFATRVTFLEEKPIIALDNSLQPFTTGIDVYGDGSIIAIALPGHARGQYGILFRAVNQQPVFLVADSCWSSKAYREYRLPSVITYLIHDKQNAYQQTLLKLHQLYRQNKQIRIIPSHCQEVWQTLVKARHA